VRQVVETDLVEIMITTRHRIILEAYRRKSRSLRSGGSESCPSSVGVTWLDSPLPVTDEMRMMKGKGKTTKILKRIRMKV
jgi:hypothetical protein